MSLLEEFNEALANVKREVAEMRVAIATAVSNYQNAVGSLNQLVVSLHEQVDTLQAANETTSTALQTALANDDLDRAEIQRLTNDLVNSNATITDLQRQIDELVNGSGLADAVAGLTEIEQQLNASEAELVAGTTPTQEEPAPEG